MHHGGMLDSLDLCLTILVGCLPLLGGYCTRGTSTMLFYVLFDLVLIVSCVITGFAIVQSPPQDPNLV
jgi:hypothetical protein